MQPRLLRFTHLICIQHFNIYDLPYETRLFSGGHPEKQFRAKLYFFIGLETNLQCFQNQNVGCRLKGCLSKSMLRLGIRPCCPCREKYMPWNCILPMSYFCDWGLELCFQLQYRNSNLLVNVILPKQWKFWIFMPGHENYIF